MPPVASNAARDRDPSNGSVPSTSSGSSAGGDSSSGRYYAYAADFSDSFNDTAVHNFQDRSESPVDSRKIKCVFVGDGAVGKTSLIVSYTTNGYPQEYVPTAFDNYSVLVRVDNQPVRLQLCDTAGQDDFDTLRPLCYPQSDVFLLCFSVVSPTSFYNLAQHWIPEIRQHAPHTPLILIGTQADLRTNVRVLLELSRYGETPVMEEEAKEFAKEINALEYIECSALTQQNLKEVFDAAILACLQINNRKSRVFLQEVKGGRTKSLKKQLRNKLKRTNSIAEEHGNPFLGDIDFEMDTGPATDRNYPHRNVQMAAVQYNGFGGHALTHCRSAVMLKRQLSTTKINEIRPQTVPPAVVKSAGQSSQKFGKLKKGWKRFLCLFT